MNKTVCIIPARYESKRFLGKVLADIGGKSILAWIYERVSQVTLIDEVIVATDNDRIRSEVEGFGGRVEMTCPDHPSGTDRVAEVAMKLDDADLIVNVQADEPFIDPLALEKGITQMLENPQFPMGTLVTIDDDVNSILNPNHVKVVETSNHLALYFSRSPIPYYRDVPQEHYLKHIGVYFYRKDFLLKLVRIPPSSLELAERLEQLRALENGYSIYLIRTDYQGISVDTVADLKKAREYAIKQGWAT